MIFIVPLADVYIGARLPKNSGEVEIAPTRAVGQLSPCWRLNTICVFQYHYAATIFSQTLHTAFVFPFNPLSPTSPHPTPERHLVDAYKPLIEEVLYDAVLLLSSTSLPMLN